MNCSFVDLLPLWIEKELSKSHDLLDAILLFRSRQNKKFQLNKEGEIPLISRFQNLFDFGKWDNSCTHMVGHIFVHSEVGTYFCPILIALSGTYERWTIFFFLFRIGATFLFLDLLSNSEWSFYRPPGDSNLKEFSLG